MKIVTALVELWICLLNHCIERQDNLFTFSLDCTYWWPFTSIPQCGCMHIMFCSASQNDPTTHNSSQCVFLWRLNSHVTARQAPAASRARESQCDLFLSSLREYFYQCGWAKLVLDGEGAALQHCAAAATDVSTLKRHLHVCESFCPAAVF